MTAVRQRGSKVLTNLIKKIYPGSLNLANTRRQIKLGLSLVLTDSTGPRLWLACRCGCGCLPLATNTTVGSQFTPFTPIHTIHESPWITFVITSVITSIHFAVATTYDIQSMQRRAVAIASLQLRTGGPVVVY